MTELSATLNPGLVLPVTTKPLGAPLEDRLREGLTGSLAGQVAIGLQIGRALAHLHAKGKTHGGLHSRCIYINADDEVRLGHAQTKSAGGRDRDIHAFGYLLYELFSAQLVSEDGIPKGPPDLELLYKTGMSPRLVQLVRQCTTDTRRPRDLRKVVHELETILRETLGEQIASKAKVWVAAGAACLAALAGGLWMLVH